MDQPDVRIREHIQRQFKLLRGEGDGKRQALFDLFRRLNYRVQTDLPPPLTTPEWSQAAREAIADEAPCAPAIIAEGGELSAPFRIIYVPIRAGQTQAARLRLTDERLIVEQLLPENRHPESLFVFSDPQQQYWHFVNVRRVSESEAERSGLKRRHLLRRIAVGPEDKLGTAIRRFEEIALPSDLADSLTAQQIQEWHDQAFNVEQVTEDFFGKFKQKFFYLEEHLLEHVDDREWAHDYALRILSRLMFVYFIQRKRWIADDPDFMANYWKRYQQCAGDGGPSFFEGWLKPLFFDAFGSPQTKNVAIPRLTHIPEDLRHALQHDTPYLNGGLFAEIPDLDTKHEDVDIADDFFDGLLHATDDPAQKPGFLEAYNFTISEDSPLDQEVAVDPEMIGRVYESLVNISEPGSDTAEDRSRQREAGIFYTPRTEIDLMCRLALSDYLRNHLGEEHRDLIYQLMFSLEPEEQRGTDEEPGADDLVARQDLWPRIAELLEKVTVVDPACGSGSFLVGMMNILADLRLRADDYVGRNLTVYQLSRDIVRTSLYGVDVMEWACHVAELRLWLQLMIHADPGPGERQGPKPLLPNLTFKIRQGDSLVQEIGGINLAHLTSDADIEPRTKSDLNRLKADKQKFYDAQQQEAAREEDLLVRERDLFRRICRERAMRLRNVIKGINRDLAQVAPNLMGEEEPVISGRDRTQLEAELANLEAQVERLEAARSAILQREELFVWDIAFVEIFSGDDQGFDIVVGNPPYVRQEKIADPQGPPGQSAAERGIYKQKLQRSVYTAFPEYFGRDPGRPRVTLGLRSDLYIYFYFHALSLLNSRGAFCFVTSNSWLDVGYGKELQEFLARQVPVHMIIDNQVKRSFANADVNTVIALFGAPRRERDACLDHTARFVMAQVPFEQLLHPVLMMEIDEAEARREEQEYRVFPRTGRELLEAGIETGETEGNGPLITVGSYGGDKWGGKYLRAPEIYWEILERAGDRLVPLGEIADVRFGIKTGANEFFYLPSKHFDIEQDGDYYRLVPKHEGLPEGMRIEAEFLAPVIFSLREIRCIEDDLSHCGRLLLKCNEPPHSLHGLQVESYIRWGESNAYHEGATCAARTPWYSLSEHWSPAPFVFPAKVGERMVVLRNVHGFWEDKKFYGIIPQVGNDLYWAVVLNSTLCRFFMDLSCRQLTGAQAIADIDVSVVEAIPVPHPDFIEETVIAPLYDVLSGRPINERVEVEYSMPDRQSLDDVLLSAMGLDTDATQRICQTIIQLVHHRLAKADNA